MAKAKIPQDTTKQDTAYRGYSIRFSPFHGYWFEKDGKLMMWVKDQTAARKEIDNLLGGSDEFKTGNDQAQDQAIAQSVERVVRELFAKGHGLWRPNAVTFGRIVQTVRNIEAVEFSQDTVQRVLTKLAREKFLRARIAEGKRFYEAVLDEKEFC